MADYQEYRRRILHRRWRRMFTAVALLVLLVLLISVGVLWKRLHRDQRPNTVEGPTILQQELTGTEWNTISYTPARRLSVQTQADGTTAMDFRLAAQPASEAVDRSWFSDVWFLGDSLTQGMQMYENGLPNAHFCAYKGVGPNAVVNGTTCKRADGVAEIPMDVLAAQQPRALYILLGTNVLNRDDDYSKLSDLLPPDAGYGLPVSAQHHSLCPVHYPGPARSAGKAPRPVQGAAVPDQR